MRAKNKKLIAAQKAENLVSSLLIQRGWVVLARNFRGVGTELDIVASKGDTLVAVEVKFRKCPFVLDLNSAQTLLSPRKKQALIRGVEMFISKHQLTPLNIRIELALVRLNANSRDLQVQYFVNAVFG